MANVFNSFFLSIFSFFFLICYVFFEFTFLGDPFPTPHLVYSHPMFTHINLFFNQIFRFSNFDFTQPQKGPPPKPPKPVQYKKVIIDSAEIDNEGYTGAFQLHHEKSHSYGAIHYQSPSNTQEPYNDGPKVRTSQFPPAIQKRNTMPAISSQPYISSGDFGDRRPTIHPQGPRLPPMNSGFSARYSNSMTPSKSNSSSYSSTSNQKLPIKGHPPYPVYEPRNSTHSNSSIDSIQSYNMVHIKTTPSPSRSGQVPTSTQMPSNDLEDPYRYQSYDKSPSPTKLMPTSDGITQKSSTSYIGSSYTETSLSPALNRRSTADSYKNTSGPLSPGASSLSSSGLHSRSTNTQYSTEISDCYDEEISPLRTSGGKLPFPDTPTPAKTPIQAPYPVTPPSRSPTKANAPPYPNATYSDPLAFFSNSQKPAFDERVRAANETTLQKEPNLFENNSSLNNPRPPLKILTDIESANSSETITNKVPRSQSTFIHDSRLSLPSRSYTMGSRSLSGSIPTIGANSLRSSSYSTADDSLMLRLDLPAIPDSKAQFDASKLSSKDFEQCKTPWLISSLSSWIQFYATQRDMTFEELSEALIGLFRHTVPTLGWVAAERVTVPLLETLSSQRFLSVNKETGLVVVDDTISPSGVLPTITGKGCYSSKAHIYDDTDTASCTNYRCYSSRCWRSLPYKSVLPEMEKALQMDDSDRLNWAKLWGLPDEDLGKLDKKVIERQSAIQELIATEETYVRGLKVFLSVYGESLARIRPPIFPQQKKFWNNTFGCIQGLIDCNGAQFLSHLKARQSQQGPYVESIADLILNWLKIAREPYINRASTYSFSYCVMASEKSKNEAFSSWLESVEHDPRVSRQQKFDFLISSPFTRLCKYNLLFGRIKDSTPPENPDHQLLDRCMEECRSILNEYNARHGEAEDLSSILTLDEKIQFRSAEEKVDLRLSEGRRKIVYESDVLRKGEFGIDFVDSHMILLDHYLIMAKVRKEHMDKYLVSKKVSILAYNFLLCLKDFLTFLAYCPGFTGS